VLEYAENHLKTANPAAYKPQELDDLRAVLSYAADGKKTEQAFFVSGVHCIPEIAFEQMTATKQQFGKLGGNLAYHAYQSFAPDEVTPEQCHVIGVALAKRIWGDRYEVLVTTHLNTHCVHNHLVINSVSYVDGKKLNNNYAMYFKNLRAESDRLCREHRLSIIAEPGQSSGSRYLQEAEKRGEPTIRNVIRSDIDTAIAMSMTDRQFYWQMREWGYQFSFDPKRKYPTLRAPGMKTVMRFATLGEEYLPERITRRILDNRRYLAPPQKSQKPVVKHYRVHGSFHNVRSASGLYVMFMIFLLLLRRIRILNRVDYHPQRLRYTPELREAIRRIDRYSEQTRLLCRYKIETPEQLTALIESRGEQRKALAEERNRVYNRMRAKSVTPEKLDALKAERDDLSKQLAAVRKELAVAHGALTSHEENRRKLKAQRELANRRLEEEKTKQKNKKRERGITR
jgi:hypothetical protein